VLALQGNLHVEDKGTPRELVRGAREGQHASRRAAAALAPRLWRRARSGADTAWRRATQAFALTVLGSMTFAPGASVSPARALRQTRAESAVRTGFYYTRLAFYAYKGYAGYSFEDIPDVD
jgi:hypothetical protein